MRIFVYLLALITGFSAAHASPEKMRAASALDNNAQAATALLEQDAPAAAQALAFVVQSFVRPDATAQLAQPASQQLPVAPRIYLGDRARE